MNEKKKLLTGIVIAVLIAGIISTFMSKNPFAEKKTKTSNFVQNMGNEFQYDLNVKERKTGKEYKPLNMNEIIKKTKGSSEEESLKTEEIKNEKGEPIGTKEYRKNGEIVITTLKKGEIISIETIEKEKNKKYSGKAELIYSDGVKQIYSYKNGLKEGKAEIIFTNGDREEYIYKNDVPEGQGIYYFANGDKEIYNYKNGVMNGEAKYIFADGKEEKYKYINGERQ